MYIHTRAETVLVQLHKKEVTLYDVCLCVCMYVYICMYAYTHIYTNIHIHTLSVCMHTMCVYTYIHYACVYIHTNIVRVCMERLLRNRLYSYAHKGIHAHVNLYKPNIQACTFLNMCVCQTRLLRASPHTNTHTHAHAHRLHI